MSISTSNNAQKRLLIVTRQAGTVAAFEPLLDYLKNDKWTYNIVAYEKSKKVWENLGYKFTSNKILQRKDIDGINLILTGTSEKVIEDSTIWSLAKSNGIPSIAFIDSWVNYVERFSLNNKFDKTPDYIGLIDNLMYQRMLEYEAPVEKLIILGHPRFDTLIDNYKSSKKERSTSEVRTVVFFTDPKKKTNKQSKERGNISEVVNFVFQKISELSLSTKKLKFIVKPHPRENFHNYSKIINENNLKELVLVTNKDPHQLIYNADVVIGMNTILLVDSSKLGIPTYSFQPGRVEKRNDITDRKNIDVITTWGGVERVISRIVFSELEEREVKIKQGNNSQKFMDFINQFA